MTPEEEEACRDGQPRAGFVWKIVFQVISLILCFNYSRKALLLLFTPPPPRWQGAAPQPKWGMQQYQHHPVPAMDGGFAMSMGFAWTQRNLLRRIDLLRSSLEKR